MSKIIKDGKKPEKKLKPDDAEETKILSLEGETDQSLAKKKSIIKEKKAAPAEDEIDDELVDDNAPEPYVFSKNIKKRIRPNGISAYFVLTTHQIGQYYKRNKKMLTAFYSVVLSTFCVVLALFVTFTFLFNNTKSSLDKMNDELAYLDDMLKQENIKYFNDILKNPSIFNIIDNGRYVEKNFIEYYVTVTYNGGVTRTFRTAEEYTKAINIGTTSGNSVTVQLIESYTAAGKRYLGTNLLRYFSSFVNQLPTIDENGQLQLDDNGQPQYAMKDYRIFFSLAGPAYYLAEDDEGNPNYEVTALMTENENIYTFEIYDFQLEGIRKEIDLVFNRDTAVNSDAKKANYVALTTDDPMEIVSRTGEYDSGKLTGYKSTVLEDSLGNSFKLPLAKNTVSERASLLRYLNSFNGTGFTDASLDRFKPLKRKNIDKESESIVEHEVTREHIAAIVDRSLEIVRSLGAEQRYFLQTLLKDNASDINTELSKFGNYPARLIEELFNTLSFVDETEFMRIYSYPNESSASNDDKTSYLRYQAAELLNKTFGVDYRLTAAEKTTADNIKAKLTAKNYTFTTAEKNLLEKLLSYAGDWDNLADGQFDNQKVYDICTALYTLKAQFKTFSFSTDKNINLNRISLATNIS